MNASRRSSLLWGVVGVLAFLVLVQGYRLSVGSLALDVVDVGGVALVVGVASAGLTHALAAWVYGNGRS